MACQIIIVASMMIVGVNCAFHTLDNCEVFGLLSEQGEVFAKFNARRSGFGLLEKPAVFFGGVGFHIPGIDMRSPT